MAGCRIVNEGVSSAVEAINGYATSYRTAAVRSQIWRVRLRMHLKL